MKLSITLLKHLKMSSDAEQSSHQLMLRTDSVYDWLQEYSHGCPWFKSFKKDRANRQEEMDNSGALGSMPTSNLFQELVVNQEVG